MKKLRHDIPICGMDFDAVEPSILDCVDGGLSVKLSIFFHLYKKNPVRCTVFLDVSILHTTGCQGARFRRRLSCQRDIGSSDQLKPFFL